MYIYIYTIFMYIYIYICVCIKDHTMKNIMIYEKTILYNIINSFHKRNIKSYARISDE